MSILRFQASHLVCKDSQSPEIACWHLIPQEDAGICCEACTWGKKVLSDLISILDMVQHVYANPTSA